MEKVLERVQIGLLRWEIKRNILNLIFSLEAHLYDLSVQQFKQYCLFSPLPYCNVTLVLNAMETIKRKKCFESIIYHDKIWKLALFSNP